MMRHNYMQFYYQCMESGCLPDRGLCHSIGDPRRSAINPGLWVFTNKDLQLFEPIEPQLHYWGCEDYVSYDITHGFTPLRQTIVLFLAAMNNEL